MTDDAIDPRWPRLLGLAVHEFRTPITVVAGYIRMLLRDRAGAITDQQRKLLEEAEKSCGRLSALVSEMSDLSALEAGTAGLNRGTVELGELMRTTIAEMPELPDRSVLVELRLGEPVTLNADATRLRSAFTSLLVALRRELVTSDRLVVQIGATRKPEVHIAIGDHDKVQEMAKAEPGALGTFNEWRGGSGLSLAIARRILAQHGGRVMGPADEEHKACALVVLPRA